MLHRSAHGPTDLHYLAGVWSRHSRQALDCWTLRSLTLRPTAASPSATAAPAAARSCQSTTQPASCSLARICSTMPRAESSWRFQTASDSRRGFSTAIQGTTWPRSSIRRPDIAPLACQRSSDPTGVLTACGFGPNGQFRSIRGNITGQATAVGATYPVAHDRRRRASGRQRRRRAQRRRATRRRRVGPARRPDVRDLRPTRARVSEARIAAESHSPNSHRSPTAPSPQPRVPRSIGQHGRTKSNRALQSLDAKKQDKGDYLQPGDLNGYLRVNDVPKIR